jgi:hypothetical protein
LEPLASYSETTGAYACPERLLAAKGANQWSGCKPWLSLRATGYAKGNMQRRDGMRTLQQILAQIKDELKGFGFNIHHHSDKKLEAILEVLIDIRELLIEQNKNAEALRPNKQ